MKRFIFLSFAFLAWGFYELSGGAEFQPPQRPNPFAATATASAEVDPVSPMPTVSTRSVAETVKTQPQPERKPAIEGLTLASISVNETAPKMRPTTERAALKVDPAKAVALTETVEQAKPEAPELDMRTVTKTRVNMRNGPGRSYNVLTKLDRGDQVEILADNGNGWVKLRTEQGRVGWIADFLLSAPAG